MSNLSLLQFSSLSPGKLQRPLKGVYNDNQSIVNTDLVFHSVTALSRQKWRLFDRHRATETTPTRLSMSGSSMSRADRYRMQTGERCTTPDISILNSDLVG
jgi:hypothetical protein